MKDIDFDELDRAVSSLLGKDSEAPKSEAAPDPTAAAAPTAAASPVAVTTPVVDPTRTQTTPSDLPVIDEPDASGAIPVTIKPVQSSVVNKAIEERQVGGTPIVPSRAGRFMDVVRPQPTKQADAIVDTPKEVNLKPLSPIDPSVKPEPIAIPDPDTTPVPVSLGVIAAPDPKTLAAEPMAEEETWADPLAAHEAVDAAAQSPVEAPVDATPVVPEQSPFLPDAVVEKRPLGAFNEPGTDAPADVDDPADDQLPATPAPLEKKLPPEFNQSLVDLESAEQSEPNTAPAATAASAAVKTDAGSTNLAAMSIPQQYKAAERTKPQNETPVFDTTQYHAPIPFADQHKSNKGVWVLVVILLLLIVVGVAYWFFFLY